MNVNDNTVWIAIELVTETDKACLVLVKKDERELWIPKRVIVDIDRALNIMGVASWWAKEHKLRSEW